MVLDVAPEPVTRSEILESLVHMSESRIRLQRSGAPANCLERLNARIDDLLERLGVGE